VVATEIPAGLVVAPDRLGRRLIPGLLYALTMAVAAGLLWYVGLVASRGQPGVVKVPLTLLGVAAGYKAVDIAGRTIRGGTFDTGLWLSVTWLVVLVAAAVFAGVLPLANYNDPTKTLTVAGNLPPDIFSAHPLGTNNFGLDLLSQSIHAARVSLLTALLAAVISVVVGGAIGLAAGYYRGWLDTVVNILTDAWLAFPALIVLLAVSTILGVPRSSPQAVFRDGIALSLVGLSTMVRVARANTLTFAQREFITASRALGARNGRLLFRHLAPNVMLPLLSYAFTLLAVFIVAEGSLAFLGLGLQQPQPSWGNMMAEGTITDLQAHPHVALVPGVVMFLTVFAFSRVGDRLRGRNSKEVQI
jgi:peptide/nickel transport system permease protein